MVDWYVSRWLQNTVVGVWVTICLNLKQLCGHMQEKSRTNYFKNAVFISLQLSQNLRQVVKHFSDAMATL